METKPIMQLSPAGSAFGSCSLNPWKIVGSWPDKFPERWLRDDTWSGTIQLTGDVIVPSGIRLDVSAGTVVKLNTGSFLRLDAGSTFNAIGNATSQIVFTSTQDDSVGEDLTTGNGLPLAGHWESIYINTSSASLAYANIRYAGNVSNPGNTFGPYRIASVHVGAGADPTFDNVTLLDGEDEGIDLRGNASLNNVQIERFGGVAIVQGLNLSPTYRNLIALSTGGNHVRVDGGTLTETESWNFGGLPAHFTDNLSIGSGGDLTLAPGTILKFSAGQFLVASAGILRAVGTLAQPIIFTSHRDDSAGGDSNSDGSTTSSGPGQWESLYVDNSQSLFENIEIRYAGNVFSPGNTFEPYRVPALQ